MTVKLIDINMWDSYQTLPPAQRIIIVFTITALLIFAVYRIDRWAKNKRQAKPGNSKEDVGNKSFLFSNLEQKADGTLIAYIGFWRYLFFGLFFAAAFYVCISIIVRLCRELPVDFWKNWDKAATAGLIILIFAICLPFFSYQLLKDGYKKIHFELTSNSVRYLKGGVRGGILLSDNYISVPLKHIVRVDLQRNLLGGGVITAVTPRQTHSVILLLSSEEQQTCLRALQERIRNQTVIGRPS
jgi:hypothetical protein